MKSLDQHELEIKQLLECGAPCNALNEIYYRVVNSEIGPRAFHLLTKIVAESMAASTPKSALVQPIPMMGYRLYDPKEKLFLKSASGLARCAKGKTWSKISHIKSALTLVYGDDKGSKRGRYYGSPEPLALKAFWVYSLGPNVLGENAYDLWMRPAKK